MHHPRRLALTLMTAKVLRGGGGMAASVPFLFANGAGVVLIFLKSFFFFFFLFLVWGGNLQGHGIGWWVGGWRGVAALVGGGGWLYFTERREGTEI